MLIWLLFALTCGNQLEFTSSQNKHVLKKLKAVHAEVEVQGNCCKCSAAPKSHLKFIQKILQPKDSWILYFKGNLMLSLNNNFLELRRIITSKTSCMISPAGTFQLTTDPKKIRKYFFSKSKQGNDFYFGFGKKLHWMKIVNLEIKKLASLKLGLPASEVIQILEKNEVLIVLTPTVLLFYRQDQQSQEFTLINKLN